MLGVPLRGVQGAQQEADIGWAGRVPGPGDSAAARGVGPQCAHRAARYAAQPGHHPHRICGDK